MILAQNYWENYIHGLHSPVSMATCPAIQTELYLLMANGRSLPLNLSNICEVNMCRM